MSDKTSLADSALRLSQMIERALARERKLREALTEIKRDQGKVCENFELCTHAACQSSYASWAIANAALADEPNDA